MSDNRDEGSPFFRVRPASWSEIDEATRADVVRLHGMLASVFSESAEARGPIDTALRLNELANRLFEQVAGDERDLRQVISTLRTAHAVAWDMHDAVQASRTTVEQHMRQLRETIDSFESDLRQLQVERAAS